MTHGCVALARTPLRVLIVGGGLAGLACAAILHERGHAPIVFEASDRVGGRVRSDRVAGFTLDRGFQIHLSAYPEAKRWFDGGELAFRAFAPAARVWDGAGFRTYADPRRMPGAALGAFIVGAVRLRDLRVALALAREAAAAAREGQAGVEGISAASWLRARGVSEELLERFFRPFFGGVFLDTSLETDAGRLRFYLGCFAAGEAVVPAGGMGRLAESLAARLPPGAVRLNEPVALVGRDAVTLADGRVERGDRVVVATDMTSASSLVPGAAPPLVWQQTTTIWFATPRPSPLGRMLHLNGTRIGPLNHVADLAAVAPEYAPRGRGLVAANLVRGAEDVRRGIAHERELAEEARRQLATWFGRAAVADWEVLRIDRIDRAVPRQRVADLVSARPIEVEGILLAGDHVADASINGALVAGRRAAEAIDGGSPVPSAA